MSKRFAALLDFGWKQALSCVFPAVIFGTLAFTKAVDLPFISNYDFILLVCLITQYAMLRSGLETKDELKVICVFHVIGTALELYKVHKGSWAYPLDAWVKIGGVPLYSGFMYASVASYMCQAWRRLDIRLRHLLEFHDASLFLRLALGADGVAVRRVFPYVRRIHGARHRSADAARSVVFPDRLFHLDR